MAKAQLTHIRLFEWAKQHGQPFRARIAAADFGVPVGNVTTVLLRLKRKGVMAREGHTHTARWFVLDPGAEVKDLRGRMPRSMANLRIGGGRGERLIHYLPKLNRGGRDDWPAATLLESCWQPCGSFPMIDAEAD